MDNEKIKMSVRKVINKEILFWVVAFLTIILTRQYVFAIGHIPSVSMENTLKIGDKIFINKMAMLYREPKIGEIIVFEEGKDLLIKRVIAKEGDTVTFSEGDVFVNGSKLTEDYIVGKTYYPGIDYIEIQVEQNHYMVLGDNREKSKDSRYIGDISREHIVGVAEVIIFPLNRLSDLKKSCNNHFINQEMENEK